jgi:hypothetical protein
MFMLFYFILFSISFYDISVYVSWYYVYFILQSVLCCLSVFLSSLFHKQQFSLIHFV